MQRITTVTTLFAALGFSLAAYAAPPPAGDIKQAGDTCERRCCCKGGGMGGGMKQGMMGGGMMGGMRDPEMMAAHRQHMQAQRAIAAELKKARTDAQRVKLMQRYIENMDEEMGRMMARMETMPKGGMRMNANTPAADTDPHAGHEPDDAKPAKR